MKNKVFKLESDSLLPNICKKKEKKKKKILTSHLQTIEISNANNLIIKDLQETELGEEINFLKKNEQLKATCKLI